MHEHTEHAEYQQLDWGDLIEGTKELLQALGLGVGRAFPGEAGGPRRKMAVQDPSGYPVTISPLEGKTGHYLAYRLFSHWPASPAPSGPLRPFAPGVSKGESLWNDVYVGTAAALEAIGIVRADQLPGAPGMHKNCVTVFSDGTIPASLNGSYRKARLPGAKKIGRHSKSEFHVYVMLSDEESMCRLQAHRRAHAAWLSHVRSLPRPPRLKPVATAARLEVTHADAKRDRGFQDMLSRIVHAVGAP